MEKVCVVILNYNNYEDTIECVKSVQKVEYNNFEIVVVDNHSNNDSVHAIEKVFGESIILLETPQNLGYAGGNNIGLRYAANNGFEYICVLNNDTVVQKDYLTVCVEYLQNNEDVAFVAPIVLEYTSDLIQSTGGKVLTEKGNVTQINCGKRLEDIYLETECDYISGACMVFRKDMLTEVGYIPENYFLFFEETEWCYKAKQKGYRNVCLSSTYIRHKGSVSINQIEGLSAYMMARNRVIFYKRNIDDKFKYIFFLFYLALETLYRAVKYDSKYLKFFGAYWDGITNRVNKKYPFVIVRED